MSFWKSLFGGGGGGDTAPPKPVRTIDHNGFQIDATPYAVDGQFQVAGVVSKEIDGVVKTHRFVRADRCGSIDDAAEIAVRKGRQIVDEQGERLFAVS